MPFEIPDPVMLPVANLHPNPWNPNEQSDVVFNMLAEEIREEGFDHPLVVCPLLPETYEEGWEGDHYRIISGEHRWRVAQTEGQTHLPCHVKHWDEVKQKTQTMRKNMLTGELNKEKFTRLVESLEGVAPREELARLMGFENEQVLLKSILTKPDPREKSFLDSLLSDAERDKHTVDGLSDVISGIFSSFGETLDQSYMIFSYKGRTHLLVLCDDELFRLVKKVTERLTSTGEDVTNLMKEALNPLFESS